MADGRELTSISSAVPQQDFNALTPTLWACGAAGQAMAARMLMKRGDGGLSMPLRAFSIASLVLGTGVCAMGGTLWASGIREVEDLRSMGRTIRSAFAKEGAFTPNLDDGGIGSELGGGDDGSRRGGGGGRFLLW